MQFDVLKDDTRFGAYRSYIPSEDAELKELLAECYGSHKTFAKTFFPQRFRNPFSKKLHDPIFSILDNKKIRKACIVAPRGIGKTSIIDLVKPAHGIVFDEERFIVLISHSAPHAIMQSESLKNVLTSGIVREIFGPMESKMFNKEIWETSTGTGVMPRGSRQQVRGLLYKDWRPSLIIADDLEDPENMDSDDQRKKKKEWFFADVMNSVEWADPNWRVIVIGSLLHEDSLVAHLMNDPAWYSLRLEICDDSYQSNWPEVITNEMIMEKVAEAKRMRLLDTFFREFRGLPISTEDPAFSQTMFRDYSEGDEKLWERPEVETVIIADPAKTKEESSCDTAIEAWGIDCLTNKLYMRELFLGKLYPDEIIGHMFRMADAYDSRVLGIEVTSLHEWVTQPLRNEALRRGRAYEIVELHAKGSKEDRAKGLLPYYRQGLVYHNSATAGPLEAALLSYPRPSRWDAIDCAAYVIEIMDEGDRYFSYMRSQEDDDAGADESEYSEVMKGLEVSVHRPCIV